MKVQAVQNGALFYAVIDDLYSQEELYGAQKEIEYLHQFKKPPDKTLTAKNTDGSLLKSGSGLFIDFFYGKRENSILLTINRKVFSKEVLDPLLLENCSYGHVQRSNIDMTLLNFYSNAEKYDAHTDKSIFTAVTFFKIGQFSGGEFCFPDYNEVIEPICGRTVLFPGCVRHQAKPIAAEENNYRVTMAQFINYKSDRGEHHG